MFSSDALASQKIASELKKTNILVTFSHCTIICFEQFSPILLFGTILLLNLTDLPPYTIIWPIRLFGTREYAITILQNLTRFYMLRGMLLQQRTCGLQSKCHSYMLLLLH